MTELTKYVLKYDPAKYPIQAAIELINYFALDAEYRPYPFISHMTDVAYWTQQFTSDPELIAAAWLHDLVEDFEVTLYDLEMMGFNLNIVGYVDWLTDPEGPAFQTRDQKKAELYRLYANTAYDDSELFITIRNGGRLVKCCDRLANMTSCQRTGRTKLMKRYLDEWNDFEKYIIKDTNGVVQIPKRLYHLLQGAKDSISYEFIPNEP